MSAASQSIVPVRKTESPNPDIAKAEPAMIEIEVSKMAADQSPTFTCFPRLPIELRLKIWKLAVIPRLVGFNPGKIQGVYQSNQESRNETKHIFKTKGWLGGIQYSPKFDIFLVDKSAFSRAYAFNYHRHAFHTMFGWLNGAMIRPLTEHFTRVAMYPPEVEKMCDFECGHLACCLETYLPMFFPALTEFILILRPGPLGATAEDLYEIKSAVYDGRRYTHHVLRSEKIHPYHQILIEEFEQNFQYSWMRGKLEGVKLSFMRLERWDNHLNTPASQE